MPKDSEIRVVLKSNRLVTETLSIPSSFHRKLVIGRRHHRGRGRSGTQNFSVEVENSTVGEVLENFSDVTT